MEPEKLSDYDFPEAHRLRGEVLLKSGRVACLILTGGHSTRLGKGVPKGVLPLTPDGKSLLELHLARVPSEVPLALLTSPFTHGPIEKHIEEKALRPSHLIKQRTLPFLDDERRPMKEEGADGTGGALHALAESGLLESWQAQGIEQIIVLPVDNPLAEPCDPYLVGSHLGAITMKCIRRREEERMGVIAREKGRVHVIEYTELPEHAWSARDEKGALLWEIGYTNLLSLSLEWVRRVVQERPLSEMPLHSIRRAGVWKTERFLLDLFPHAERTDVLIYPRERCYAPWKTEEGPQGRAAVLRALN